MHASEPELARWLAGARAGSGEALGRLLQLCRNYLLLVANEQLDADLRGKGGASDLVQETFLEAQRDFARFQGATEAEWLAWLRRILVNNAGNFTRRFRTGKRDAGREVMLGSADSAGPVLPDSLLTPSSQAMEREEAAALQQALARLSDDYRRVLVLRYQDGRSFAEIGRLLERSAEAARKLWARAMERLQEESERAHESR